MPNYCANHVTITGDKETIKILQQKLIQNDTNEQGIQSQYVDFNGIVPMPKSLDVVSCSSGKTSLELINLMGSELLINTRFGEEPFLGRLSKVGFINESISINGTFINQITIAELLTWLSAHPDKQEKLCLDLELGRQYMSNIIQHGQPTWYEWCRDHWGTKWNACNSEILDMREDCLVVQFDTAWGYPEAWYEKLCEEFPDIGLTVLYCHDSGYSAGILENDNGCLIHYPCDDDEIGHFVHEHFGWDVEAVS